MHHADHEWINLKIPSTVNRTIGLQNVKKEKT